uniref:DNA oxidative demethylase ALKBH2 n=2 Tax=Sparus aurata TaxID=8175 RepID=A0A671XAI8_SPAAU
MFCSSLHHPGPEKKFLKVSQTIRFPAMEKFVVPRRQKRSGTSEAPSPQKKIKLESDEKMKQEEEEEEEEEGEHASSAEFSHPVPWQKIEAEGLDCDYALLFSKEEADKLFRQLEEEVVYSTGEEARVQVFGKVYDIPRKQATYGDAGLTYTYSGVKRLACPWTPTLEYIRDAVTKTTGQTFNFVLVNRYKDGQDHMGEHRDDEKELDPLCPIASVSLGAARDFIFRHKDTRGNQARRQIEPVKMELAHGSLLLMNSPTNTFWYHSLPVRKRISQPRINLTFRRILKDAKK